MNLQKDFFCINTHRQKKLLMKIFRTKRTKKEQLKHKILKESIDNVKKKIIKVIISSNFLCTFLFNGFNFYVILLLDHKKMDTVQSLLLVSSKLKE